MTQASDDNPEWELLCFNGEAGDYTSRMKVPGGWLYKQDVLSTSEDGANGVAVALVFVPDPPD